MGNWTNKTFFSWCKSELECIQYHRSNLTELSWVSCYKCVQWRQLLVRAVPRIYKWCSKGILHKATSTCTRPRSLLTINLIRELLCLIWSGLWPDEWHECNGNKNSLMFLLTASWLRIYLLCCPSDIRTQGSVKSSNNIDSEEKEEVKNQYTCINQHFWSKYIWELRHPIPMTWQNSTPQYVH